LENNECNFYICNIFALQFALLNAIWIQFQTLSLWHEAEIAAVFKLPAIEQGL
jgi:hypothetical protein